MSVDLPSSTLPQVLKRRISTGSGAAVRNGGTGSSDKEVEGEATTEVFEGEEAKTLMSD
jgi:molybdopterin biosynthesis enzyme MoaB